MTIGPAPDWTDVTWLVANYEGTPTLVGVDGDGNLIAVMKGEYAGTLKTLKTDEDGRLIAILTDPEDVWGVFQQMGLGGLAAVLHPAKRFDFRGHVVWWTDFDEGLQGSLPASDHVDSTYSISTDRASSGGMSLKLDPRGADDAYVEWSRTLGMAVPKKVGYGTSISLDDSPYLLRWLIYYYDGTNRNQGQLRYDPDSGDWEIRKADGDFETILEGYELRTGSSTWHEVKLVVDFENDIYLRLLVGDHEVDLSEYGLYVTAAADLKGVVVLFAAFGSVDVSEACYLGSVVVTQNEPGN